MMTSEMFFSIIAGTHEQVQERSLKDEPRPVWGSEVPQVRGPLSSPGYQGWTYGYGELDAMLLPQVASSGFLSVMSGLIMRK
jgi:hypothetical protein